MPAREVLVQELINKCAENDSDGWDMLWPIVEDATLFPIREILWRRDLDLSLAEDMLQELFIHLSECSARRLRSFRGTTEAELRVFLRTTGVRLALRYLQSRKRREAKENKALNQIKVPDRSGPTEKQVHATLEELEATMSKKNRRKLAVVASSINGYRPPKTLPSPTTLRRWRREIYQCILHHVR